MPFSSRTSPALCHMLAEAPLLLRLLYAATPVAAVAKMLRELICADDADAMPAERCCCC